MPHCEADTYQQVPSPEVLLSPIRDTSRHAIGMEKDPTLSEIRNVYDNISRSFLRERKNPNGLFNRFIWPVFSNQIGDVKDQNVLDIGCGPGVVADKLAVKGAHVVGIDISAPMLRTAYENYGEHAHFMEANVEHLPFADETVDKVISSYVLNHLGPTQLKRAFLEVHRVLKEGGRFILLEPHPDRNQMYYENSGKMGPFPEGWYGEVYPETNGVPVPCYYRKIETWITTIKRSPFYSNVSSFKEDPYFFVPTSDNTWVPGISKDVTEHYRTNRVLIANLVK